jgi:hypothetical protein
MDMKNGYETGSAGYAKTDVRYWRDRVYKPASNRNFAVKLQFGGKRMTLGLYTVNKEEAAQHARRMYLDLVSGGWELLLKKHRTEDVEDPVAPEPKKEALTFGRYIDLVRSKNLLAPKAINGYVPRLRTIISEILDIKSSKKYAAATSGRQAWIDRVDAVLLTSITPDMVRRWKRVTIDKSGNATARKHATTSVNSMLRQARSLFGERKVLRFIEIPRPHLFEGVEFEPKVDTRFWGAGVDAPTLLRRALKELPVEQVKAFLLGIALGLRRKECDLLQWDSFDFDACTVTVRPTEHHSLKTEESASVMALDPEFMVMFRGWHAQSRGVFVLESDHVPRPDAGYHYYRCDATFDALVDWLRLQGIKTNKPLHTLRKMFGSLIVEKAGVFAASSALRHTSIELTTSYYLDRSVKTVSGLGNAISGAQNPVFEISA